MFEQSMFKQSPDKIIVLVDDATWRAFGSNPQTFRQMWLYKLLRNMGGVNESVPAGVYYFTAKRVGLLKWEANLTPYTE